MTPRTAHRKSAAARCGSGGLRGLLQSLPQGAARVKSITSVDREETKGDEADTHTSLLSQRTVMFALVVSFFVYMFLVYRRYIYIL